MNDNITITIPREYGHELYMFLASSLNWVDKVRCSENELQLTLLLEEELRKLDPALVAIEAKFRAALPEFKISVHKAEDGFEIYAGDTRLVGRWSTHAESLLLNYYNKKTVDVVFNTIVEDIKHQLNEKKSSQAGS